MNNTKWNEIFRRFYSLECEDIKKPSVLWMTKCRSNGFIYGWEATWTHFYDKDNQYADIEWLKIKLTPENREVVLSILSDIHVPGEILGDIVIVYGYSEKSVDYLSFPK